MRGSRAARSADSDLTDAWLSEASLELAELERVVFTGASVTGTLLADAQVTGGTWTHANLSRLKLPDAVVQGTDFTASDMEGAIFERARVSDARFDGVRFGNAVFDGAEFHRCSFRGASFGQLSRSPEPTSAGARLVDCDLPDTEWTDRDLSKTTFVRCKLEGAHGKPKTVEGLVLEACDVDAPAFVRQLSGEPKPARPLVDTIRELVADEPPRTAGLLFEALGVTLDAALLEGNGATGTIVVPPRALDVSRPRLTARYVYDATSQKPIATMSELRGRTLLSFWIVCLPKDAVDAALRARFGAPSEIAGARGDDLRVFGRAGAPGWVQTARSAVVAWFARLPEWLAAPADPAARSAALRAILEGVRGASNLDEVRAIVATLPAAAGVVVRDAHARDHLELASEPPVAARYLEATLVLQSVVATRDADGTDGAWSVRRLPHRNEADKTAALALGTWPILPRLAGAPTGGRFDDLGPRRRRAARRRDVDAHR